MIKINSVHKKYWGKFVLRDINITIKRERKYIFKGKNGSGKTTLINLILKIENTTKGSIDIEPHCKITYLSQFPEIINYLTIYEFLVYSFKKSKTNPLLIEKELKKWNLLSQKNTLLKEASGGMKKKTLLISILNSNSDLIIFDEPYNNLDLETKKILNDELEKYQASVILVSHENENLKRFKIFNFKEGNVINVN